MVWPDMRTEMMKTGGFTEKSLYDQEQNHAGRHVKAATSALVIYSLITEAPEKDEKGMDVVAFYFYKITKESTKAVLEGTAQHSRIRIAFPGSTMEDMLRLARFRTVAKHGIFIRGLDGKRLAGFTEDGLKMLCTKAGMRREQALKRSSNRDFFISEMIFSRDECVFAVENGTDGGLLIDGFFGANYIVRKEGEVNRLCRLFTESPGFGGEHLVLYRWEETNGILDIRMEYEGSPFTIDGESYTAGIRVKDSRTGKCSFTIQATIRQEGSDDYIILCEKKVRHDTRQDISSFCAVWRADMDRAIAAYIIKAVTDAGQQAGFEKLRCRLENTDFPVIVGKKRMQRCRTFMTGKEYRLRRGSTISCSFMLQDYLNTESGMGDLQKERMRKTMGGIL